MRVKGLWFSQSTHGGTGFHWTDIEENAHNLTFGQYVRGLVIHLLKSNSRPTWMPSTGPTLVLVLSSGRSSHTETGWMSGAGQKVIVYIPKMVVPELMYKLFNNVTNSISHLLDLL